MINSLKPLSAVALAAKYLKVLYFRTSTCGIRINMVYRKSLYLLLVSLTSSFKATSDTGIRISLIGGFPNRFWDGRAKPPSYTPFGIQHMLRTFFLLDMNNSVAYRAGFSSTRKF